MCFLFINLFRFYENRIALPHRLYSLIMWLDVTNILWNIRTWLISFNWKSMFFPNVTMNVQYAINQLFKILQRFFLLVRLESRLINIDVVNQVISFFLLMISQGCPCLKTTPKRAMEYPTTSPLVCTAYDGYVCMTLNGCFNFVHEDLCFLIVSPVI